MQERRVRVPELVLVAVTRGMLGLGAGLLLAEHLGRDRRRSVGRALVGIGVISTLPLALRVFRRRATDHEPLRAREVPMNAPVNPGATLMAD